MRNDACNLPTSADERGTQGSYMFRRRMGGQRKPCRPASVDGVDIIVVPAPLLNLGADPSVDHGIGRLQPEHVADRHFLPIPARNVGGTLRRPMRKARNHGMPSEIVGVLVPAERYNTLFRAL